MNISVYFQELCKCKFIISYQKTNEYNILLFPRFTINLYQDSDNDNIDSGPVIHGHDDQLHPDILIESIV